MVSGVKKAFSRAVLFRGPICCPLRHGGPWEVLVRMEPEYMVGVGQVRGRENHIPGQGGPERLVSVPENKQ